MKLNSQYKYVCDNCHDTFSWNDESSWFGSYQQMERKPKEIKHYCSTKCAKRSEKENLKDK